MKRCLLQKTEFGDRSSAVPAVEHSASRLGLALVSGVLLLACSKPAGNAPAAVDAAAPSVAKSSASLGEPNPSEAPDGRMPGESCEKDSDCAGGQRPGCEVKCQTSYVDGNPADKYCQLRTKSGVEGAQGCVGETFRGTTKAQLGPKIGRAVLCDLEKGLFCDQRTRSCTRTRAAGQPCTQGEITGMTNHDECGPDGVCADDVCRPAAAVGASCEDFRCVAAAFCGPKKVCEGLRPLGSACERDSECASDNCLDRSCASSTPASSPACTL